MTQKFKLLKTNYLMVIYKNVKLFILEDNPKLYYNATENNYL